MQFIDNDLSKMAGMADLVFTALPTASRCKLVPQLASSGLKVVDLSADFRLKDPADYPTLVRLRAP